MGVETYIGRHTFWEWMDIRWPFDLWRKQRIQYRQKTSGCLSTYGFGYTNAGGLDQWDVRYGSILY